MANNSKEHTSIRVHAPPGGHSNNIFGPSLDEQSAANKKKNTQSDIFGTKTDNANPAPAKPSRNTGSNIFGTDPEESAPKAGTIAGQYKQTQMKSNIFGPEEPSTGRNVSNKNQSNIFGVGDDDQSKRQTHVRQGLRVGYNPINGESYNTPAKANEPEPTAAESTSAESASTESNTKNEQAPASANENEKPQETPASEDKSKPQATPAADNSKSQATNDNAQKPVHTSVRVFHPPGGRSNGPLW